MEYLTQTMFWWHLGLAAVGMFGINFVIKNITIQIRLPIAFFGIMLIGYLYELYQGKSYDTGTDLLADVIGAIIATLVIILWEKKTSN